MEQSNFAQFIPLILLVIVMYFLMIRPQKKKDKQIQEMRNSLQVGDEIVTIGGLRGKIVKVKEESIILQVGVEKVKLEFEKWAVSNVTKQGPKHHVALDEQVEDEEPTQKKGIKRLKREEAPAKEEAPANADVPAEEAPAEELQAESEEALVEEK